MSSMYPVKLAAKVAYYYQNDSSFSSKMREFYKNYNRNVFIYARNAFNELISYYTDLKNCTIDELWYFISYYIDDSTWNCDCSNDCRSYSIFSLAAQNLKRSLNVV